ncbi:MAG: hypothetical protein E6J42_04730 [Chloroflexi bacterium]|nr:MAG: hypothetical protein E6J42_04730 [Chloroflexota bacterium]
MLAQRVITAVVGIPILVLLNHIGDGIYTVVAALLLGLAALEFFATTDPENLATSTAHPHIRRAPPGLFQQRRPAMLAACAVVVVVILADGGLDQLAGGLAAAVAGVFVLLVLSGEPHAGLRDWSWLLAGIFYVGFLGAHFILLRDLDQGEEWVLLALFATFVADTAAFFAGRRFGRVLIAPEISPGKTLEGSFAGYIGGFVAVLLLAWLLDLDISASEAALLGLLLPPVAIAGDLAESLLKRGGGVKDTGAIVPGHGGLLDRIDSLLFTVPLVYYFVLWIVY